MGFNKGHMEFTTLNLKEGFHNVPGYPPGFSERILAGSLDEKNKTALVAVDLIESLFGKSTLMRK